MPTEDKMTTFVRSDTINLIFGMIKAEAYLNFSLTDNFVTPWHMLAKQFMLEDMSTVTLSNIAFVEL